MGGDETGDGAFQLLNAAMGAMLDLALCQDAEPAFDLVEPGGAGWGEMDMVAGPFGEPRLDRRRLVSSRNCP